MNEPMPTCNVCEKRESVGVACVPGMPFSAAYCRECLQAGAHPLDVLIANTACLGGLRHSADWWKLMVMHTLAHLGKTRRWFNAEVRKSMKEDA